MRSQIEVLLVIFGLSHMIVSLIGVPQFIEIANGSMISPAPVPFSNFGLHTDKFIKSNTIVIHLNNDTEIEMDYHDLKRKIPGPTRYRMSYVGADHNVVTARSFKHKKILTYGICSRNGPIYKLLKIKDEVVSFKISYNWHWISSLPMEVEIKCPT